MSDGGGGGEGRAWGGGGLSDYVRHLVRIVGELKNFDKNFFHSLRSTTSQIVSC